MTNESMLKELIELAVSNGWDKLEMWSRTFIVKCDPINTSLRNRVWIEYEAGDGEMVMAHDILFDLDFARAVFGEEIQEVYYCPKCDWYKEFSKHDSDIFCPKDGRRLKQTSRIFPGEQPWQYHLQQLAITPEENRIEYAYKNRRVK